MRISQAPKSIPKSAKKIYSTHSKTPIKAWNRQFKLLKDSKLVRTLKGVLTAGQEYDTHTWTFVGAALNELNIRRWRKNHSRELEDLKNSLSQISKLCFSSRGYAIETAGLTNTDTKKHSKKPKIYHPYAFSKTAQRILYEWEDSKTTKSLEKYIEKKIPEHEGEFLKTHTITYVTHKEQEDYITTFDKGLVRIGGKIPKNGWYIYVLTSDYTKLYSAIKKIGKFHHSSFISGAPVASAGEFYVSNGRITNILLRSGHYRPTEEHGENLHKYLAREENLGPGKNAIPFIEPYDN